MAINREKVLEAAQKFVEKKKYDKAIVEYQKIIQEDPNDARILLKIGDVQSKMEAYEQAVATYEKVGKFYATQGFALKAIAVYKQIRELIAKHVPQLEDKYGHIAPKLAELYQQLGLTSDALAALDEVATRLQRAGKDGEAIATFRKIVELDPTNPLPHLRLAEGLSRGQDIEGAVTEFSVAVGLLLNLGRRDDAIKVLERLLHHKPDPEKARQAAELYLARSQPNDGMAALSKLQLCFQADPKNLDTLNLLAHAFQVIGQAAKAIEVQKEMARIALEQGKQDLFVAMVERLRKQVPQDETIMRMAQQAGMGEPAAPQVVTHQVPTQFQQPSPPPPQVAAPPARPMAPPAIPRPQAPVPMAQPEAQYLSMPPDDLEEVEEIIDDAEDAIEAEDDDADERGFGRPMPGQQAQQAQFAPAAPVAGGMPAPPVPLPPPAVVQPTSMDRAVARGTASTSQARVAQILADAASFRRVRLYKKAIETLRTGAQIDPRNVEVYETLRQVLFEARQEDESIEVGLTLAGLYVDALDGESAARVLQDVLALDSRNPRALEMLHELGYELADEGGEAQEVDESHLEQGGQTDLIDIPPDMADEFSDPQHGQLASYDLEEMGPNDVSHRYGDPARQAHGLEVDDPFATGDQLPSFPDGTGEHAGYGTEPPMDGAEYQRYEQQANETMPRAATSPPQYADLEDALEEAEFFASRGLYADARTILHDLLERHPNHPLINDRMIELDEQEQAARDNGDPSGGYGMTLDDIEAAPSQAAGFSAAVQQVDVEEVFAKFKEGVARQISIDDAQSHYDLGVAYKEMGLTDDAIREFETAARDEKRECVCLSMVGMIEMERGNIEQALDAFVRGVSARVKQPDQEMVLNFEIGACHESLGNIPDALSYYQKVQRRDPKYREVDQRIARLSGGGDRSAVRAQPSADDDFDNMFDDLVDEKN